MVVLLLCSPAIAAEDPVATWLSDANGCKFLAPRDDPPPRQMRWDGTCVDGYLSGKGTADFGSVTFQGEFSQGLIVSGELTMRNFSYRGEFKKNRPAGHGVLSFPNGALLEGEFVDSKPVGVVDMTNPDGARYRGEVNSKGLFMEGKGRLTLVDGAYYEGDFLRDQFHGKGKYVWPGGASYTGDYAFGRYNGKGILEYSDGSRYEGEFVAGNRQGQGTYFFADGSRYVGEYLADKMHGKGRMQLSTGGVEEGEWRADKLHGQCKIIYANESVYTGQCTSGQFSGQGRFEDRATGLVYEGSFLSGQYHGQGRLSQPGYAYDGSYVAGMRSGHGKEVFENGDQYEGEFARNLRHGRGVMRATTLDGAAIVYNGEYKDGVIQGQGTLEVGAAVFKGEFKGGIFTRGLVRTTTGRSIEVDTQAQTYLEVRADGTKVPIDPDELTMPGI